MTRYGWAALCILTSFAAAQASEPKGARPASSSILLAQAGSVGGTLGKKDKSVSGDIGESQPPAKRKPVHRAMSEDSADTARKTGKKCPNIVGVWNSWASGLFGQGDTVFKQDGTATHRSGIPGVWKCDNGKLMISWGGETFGEFKLDSNKLVNSDGGVGFSR